MPAPANMAQLSAGSEGRMYVYITINMQLVAILSCAYKATLKMLMFQNVLVANIISSRNSNLAWLATLFELTRMHACCTCR